jgi:hypothetical protein
LPQLFYIRNQLFYTQRHKCEALAQARNERGVGGAALKRCEQAPQRVTPHGGMDRTYVAMYNNAMLGGGKKTNRPGAAFFVGFQERFAVAGKKNIRNAITTKNINCSALPADKERGTQQGVLIGNDEDRNARDQL